MTFRASGRLVLADDQVMELQEWAKGLAGDDRPEFRAAARAIQLLATDLLVARSRFVEDQWVKGALENQEATVEWSLRNRLDHPADCPSDECESER
jgi:hypothetical protein